MAYQSLRQEYLHMPVVTRAYTTACVITTLAVVSIFILRDSLLISFYLFMSNLDDFVISFGWSILLVTFHCNSSICNIVYEDEQITYTHAQSLFTNQRIRASQVTETSHIPFRTSCCFSIYTNLKLFFFKFFSILRF